MPTNSKNRRPFEKEPGEGKAHEMQESPAEEVREGSEDEEKMAKKPARKNRKVPMDSEGGACCNTKKGKPKCSACASGQPCPGKAMKDADCGMKKRSDALTAPEYLAACELGIQNRSRPYIRARLDALSIREDLKCGKGSISQGEKCHKGPASRVSPEIAAAKNIAARTAKSGRLVEYSDYNRKTGKLQKGPSPLIRAGQAVKGASLGALEVVKWTSGYNIGKAMVTGATRGKNEKGSLGSKVGATVAAGLVFGPQAALGAARRAGAFGPTDLQQHAMNEKKEKAWRRSVGYRDGATYAKGFNVDFDQLAI